MSMGYQEDIKEEIKDLTSIWTTGLPSIVAGLTVIAAELRELNDNIEKLTKRIQSNVI